jgi:hypothetical protein
MKYCCNGREYGAQDLPRTFTGRLLQSAAATRAWRATFSPFLDDASPRGVSAARHTCLLQI